MLSVYIISVLASIFFGFSLQSVRAGVFSLFIILSCCDLAVMCSSASKYVGPTLVVQVAQETLEDAINFLTKEMAVAEKNAIRYEKCVSRLENKAWSPSQTIPSHRWIHDYCSQQ